MENDYRSAINSAQSELANIDSEIFSKEGYTVLHEKIGEYISNIISESIRITKRYKLDVVSKSQVEEASTLFGLRRRATLKRWFTSLGGVLLGLGLKTFTTYISTETACVGRYDIITMVIFFLVGTFLLVKGIE